MHFIQKQCQKMLRMYFFYRYVRYLETIFRDKIQSDVGFTIDPLTAHSVEENDAWVVSISGYETIFLGQPTRKTLRSDIIKNCQRSAFQMSLSILVVGRTKAATILT